MPRLTATRFPSRDREFSSSPATTCCKPGEDSFSKLPLEHGLDQQQATGSLQESMSRASCFATILFGVDRNHLSVQRAMRIFLADQLAGLLARPCQPAQPREPMPHATMGQRGPPFCQGMVLAIVIHQGPLLGANRFPVGLLRSQKVLRFLEHRLADELLVTQSERGGSP
jgi:hypothetical protein